MSTLPVGDALYRLEILTGGSYTVRHRCVLAPDRPFVSEATLVPVLVPTGPWYTPGPRFAARWLTGWLLTVPAQIARSAIRNFRRVPCLDRRDLGDALLCTRSAQTTPSSQLFVTAGLVWKGVRTCQWRWQNRPRRIGRARSADACSRDRRSTRHHEGRSPPHRAGGLAEVSPEAWQQLRGRAAS